MTLYVEILKIHHDISMKAILILEFKAEQDHG
jgi:hypothetical protein